MLYFIHRASINLATRAGSAIDPQAIRKDFEVKKMRGFSNNVARCPKSNLQNKLGLTMPELLLAVAILSFVLTEMLLVFTKLDIANEAARNLATATRHADFVLEDIRNRSFSSLTTLIGSAGTSGTWDWETDSEFTTAAIERINGNETINTEYSDSNPLTVTVTIYWKNRNGLEQTKVFRTVISNV